MRSMPASLESLHLLRRDASLGLMACGHIKMETNALHDMEFANMFFLLESEIGCSIHSLPFIMYMAL